MKNILSLSLLALIFLVGGCATTGPVKNVMSSNVFYTDASQQVAFDASIEALQKLGYNIEIKDRDNFYIKGLYYTMLLPLPISAQIDVTKEAAGTKLTCSVDYPCFPKIDAIGRYAYFVNNIYAELQKNLEQKGYKAQKSR
jgi:hypothetical protein